ncbi:hybrid sensor histidine kinase/response regulator [Algoriphagus aquimarinus]|uniref:hybrid sensor histidine kinase/response regulator n=1 Tax=Algoriphagus aquimarinus TaxID=237018 RepID=UPI0030DC6895|tara:strand:- start:50511 stop:54632 length:4122 start_codon:yes stop_codon:yes gene_type:complete
MLFYRYLIYFFKYQQESGELSKKLNTLNIFFLAANLISLLGTPVIAQTAYTRINYYNLEDGLSQVSINDLIQDKNGFVWIATQDGLNRFDGREFKIFKYSESDSTTISGDLVNKILEDDEGKIWAGTIGNGLSYYDPDQGVFHRVSLDKSTDENEIISALLNDQNGDIWVSSRISGLHHLTSDSRKQTRYFKGEPLSALFLDAENKLWIGTPNGLIYKADPADRNSFGANPETVVQGHVQAFYPTKQELLIGSDFGLFIYDFGKKSIKHFNLAETGLSPTKHVISFLRESDSQVWVGTGSGLYLFNWKTQSVVRKIIYNNEQNISLSSGTVQSLLRISEKQILVGTANSLNQIDFSEPYFKNISKDLNGDHSLNDNVIFSILRDGLDLWVGTSDGGLNLIRGGKNYFFKENQNKPKSISGAVVRSIKKDSKNNRLWIATTRGLNMIDLNSFDPSNPEFLVFHFDPTNQNSLNNDFLKDLAIDANQNIWGATNGQGIFRLEFTDENDYHFFRYSHAKSDANSLSNDFSQCIRIDKSGNIWIGTQAGVTKLSFESPTYQNPIFENYSRKVGQEQTLSHNTVYDILFDRSDRVWIGSRHGLNLFLGENKFKSWTENQQFPNAIIYSIQDDDNGQLWLGTNDGIVKFEPDTEKFTHYGTEDGIQSKEFDIHAKFKDEHGTIYLGGIGGVTYFHPSDLLNIDQPKPLYFSELRVNHKNNKANNPSNLLEKPLLTSTSLTFKHNQFPFYLQFSSLDFRMNKKVEYGYKLLPNDQEWNMLKDPEVQFLNLPSGTHTLLVNGFARGKEWNQEPLRMTLIILPPWWASWWAYLLYFMAAALLAYWFYRFQLSRKLALAESRRLKEVNQLKSSLYTNITHEFRTPLTVILGMVETIKAKLANEEIEATDRPLEMIQRNGSKLLKLVNELLTTAKAESGEMHLSLIQADVIPFVKYICESFQSLAAKSTIQLTVYSEVESLTMDFDAEKLSVIITNLISNAIKFTLPNGKILVHLKENSANGHHYFFIKVKDNGTGIPEDNIPHIFDRFYQVHSSSSRMGEGTGIGLALTREFVTLMNGSVSVQSKLEKGSELIVQIPISRNATITTEVNLNEIPTNHFELEYSEYPEEIPQEESDLPLALIIEDNIDVAFYLKSCLGGKYDIVHALNGEEGIKLALEKVPDIIICDVMMPGITGYEVCSKLKSDQRTDHIPIIILTAKASSTDRIIGLSHGADAFLSKPFNKDELFTRLDQLILLRSKMRQKFQQDGFNGILTKRSESPEAKFLKRAIALTRTELDDPSFSSRHLAFGLSLSESQVYRKLKAITGKSTAIFIRSIRLQQAKELLQTSDKTVSEVGYAVGFNDPSWFSRAFKEEFGFAPSTIHK